ncbi:MAG TPA: glycosyltransferase family 39 protein [Bacteroidales bacterium]|nr:glycosyltransferase family 39 protein [Bacteroidales bacterium]
MNNIATALKITLLEKPILSILLISMLLTLPWIGIGEFYTKGEPREAAEALSMIQDGNWVLPMDYADEIGYKPPLMHWFIAGISLMAGSVSEWSSRLPSALGLIGMAMLTLIFLKKRKNVQTGVISALILLTCFELHRYSIECRVDMMLAFFMSASLFGLFKWEEKRLAGYPVLTVLCLACACLVKGPIGALLPVGIFGLYLLLRGNSFWKVLFKCLLVALPALLILGIWYVLAYQIKGDYFLNVVIAENIGRFLGMKDQALGITYNLGHQGPFWYYIPALILGLMPWSLIPIMLLFVIPYRKKWKSSSLWQRFVTQDAFTLFSMLIVIVFVVFYSMPTSKRSVYIMPIYPFVAYLSTKIFFWAEHVKPVLFKILYWGAVVIAGFLLLLSFVAFFVDIRMLIGPLVQDAKTTYDVALFARAFKHPPILSVFLWFLLLSVTLFFTFGIRSKNVRTTIFGIFTVCIGIQVYLEGALFPVYKNGYSLKPLAETLGKKYDLEHQGYVMNQLLEYRNIYGLNFYLGNHFKNFDIERPKNGFLIAGEKSLEKVRKKYEGLYRFDVLECSTPYNELNDEIVVCQIIKL